MMKDLRGKVMIFFKVLNKIKKFSDFVIFMYIIKVMGTLIETFMETHNATNNFCGRIQTDKI